VASRNYRATSAAAAIGHGDDSSFGGGGGGGSYRGGWNEDTVVDGRSLTFSELEGVRGAADDVVRSVVGSRGNQQKGAEIVDLHGTLQEACKSVSGSFS